MKLIPDELINRIWLEDESSDIAHELYVKALEFKELYYATYISKKLTPEFQKLYTDNNMFHDACINNINIIKNKNKSIDIAIELTIQDKKIKIEYIKITNFQIGCHKDNIILYYDKDIISQWLIDEFYLVDDNTLSHEILLDGGIIIKIEFSLIRIS
jgi:hypothetical protein